MSSLSISPVEDMAEGDPPTILVRFEGNQSERYDNTEEEIWLHCVVAVNNTAVVEPSRDQLRVGDYIEYEFVTGKGDVQVLRGILVSIDPEAERRVRSTRASRPVSAKTTTKGVSCLPSSDTNESLGMRLDMDRRAIKSGKGKRQKRLSTSPLPGAGPKRNRGTSMHATQQL